MAQRINQPATDEWVSFPGGELEGRRPKTLCQACREKLALTTACVARPLPGRQPTPTLCFQCYRADFERDRALRAAGQLDTASDARLQQQLPFEPVDHARLAMLKAERSAAHVEMGRVAPFVDRRRHAQIAARHALQAIAEGLQARQAGGSDRDRILASAIHAAELQLPESWIPFVVAH